MPQGSILGPLLFLFYINDLADVCKCSLPILFADDSNLFHHGIDSSVIECEFNKDLADISTWLSVNKLSLNIKNPLYDILAEETHPLDLLIDNRNVHITKASKSLGIYIDDKLNWKRHISFVAGKIDRGIGLGKSRKYFNDDYMINLYNAFMYPYHMYCNQMGGSTYKTNLSTLQVLQNKAVRIVTGSPTRSNSEICIDVVELWNWTT